MTNTEAKFLLRAYRPDGSDAQDPLFTQAIAQAERDPELGAWFKRERSVDETLSTKLAKVPVPDLKATILAGVRAGRQRRAWWRRTTSLAAAAAIVVACGLWVRFRPVSASDSYALTRFAFQDVTTDMKDHLGAVPGLSAVQTSLSDPSTRISQVGIPEDMGSLQRDGGRTVQVAGKDVCEICFSRGGVFHLYIAKRSDFDAGSAEREPLFVEQGAWASASWSDARYVYVAVTDAGMAALRKIL